MHSYIWIVSSIHETTAGVPAILFTIPEEFGGFDCRVPVSNEKLQEVQVECIRREEIEDPTGHNEAVHIFDVLMSHA